MRKFYLTLASVTLLGYCAVFAQTTVTFNYTGAVQTWVVPACVTKVTVTVNGAAGGTGGETSNNSQDIGGDGGSVVGVLNVIVGSTLNIYVGGAGQNGTPANGGGLGGWNGGGFGLQGYFAPPPWLWFAGGGGGASDIRVGGNTLANRVVVGGGGGGAGFNYFACCNYDRGGPGGGLTGQSGWSGNVQGAGGSGTGGTQATGGIGGTWGGYCTCANGVLGIGSNDCVGGFSGNAGGGGGGGYYGGGAGCWSGGGGGSSYTGGLASVTSNTQGVQAGNGVITITYVGGGAPLTLAMSPPVNPTCGLCNGSQMVMPSGGSAPYTYLWSPSNQTNANATGLCAGTYTVTVTDACGDVATSAVTLTSNPVIVTANVASNELCNGNCTGSINTVVAGGTAPYTYAWTPSGGNGPSASNLCVGTYTVTVTDINGCNATASATITQPAPLTATINGSIPCNGGVGTATALPAGGTGPYTYVWTPAGGSNALATGLSIGSYTVNITDNNGCTTSASITLINPPLLTATMGAPTNVSCFGGTGSATVTAGGGTPGYGYSWSPIGGNAATGIGLTAGNYTVTVTDANGCQATAGVTITQPPLLTASITPTHISCNGGNNGTAMATAGGGTPGYGYLWSPIGNTNAFGTGLTAGSYTMTITDANGCTATAAATLTQPAVLNTTLTVTNNVSCFGGSNGGITSNTVGGTAPYTYSWSNAQTTANVSGLIIGNYSVTVTDNQGCTATATTSINEPPQLTLSVSGPSEDCSGAPVTLTANPGGGVLPYTYAWAPVAGAGSSLTTTPAVTTTYTSTVTDAHGCVITATITVLVRAPLSIVIAGKKSVCPNQAVNITAIASGGDGIYSYLWVPSNLTTQNISFTPKHDTTITVQLTDGCGSTMASQVVPITVDALPRVSFSADVLNGCAPLCIQFRDLTASPDGIYQWGWGFGNGDSSSMQSPIYCYKDTGIYSVVLTVTSDSGCSSTLNVFRMITVYPPPVAGFTYSPQPVNILSPTVQFTDQSTSKYPITQWYWRFGEGDSLSSLPNPEHTYPDTGTFCPTLVVVDIHGCVDSITNCLVVNPQFEFYIPDAFTPNGDDVNDVFAPKGSYVSNYEMYIFDRWGMQIFHTNDFKTGWNGRVKNNGQACPQDMYIYLINVTDSQGNKHSYTGKVNLVK